MQFRAIDAASGLREPHFIAALEAHGPIPPRVQKYLNQPTLQDLLLSLIEHEGTDVKQLYVGPGGTLGARYLAKTVSQRFFPKLWEARGEMFVSE